jgi:hypothetical protein
LVLFARELEISQNRSAGTPARTNIRSLNELVLVLEDSIMDGLGSKKTKRRGLLSTSALILVMSLAIGGAVLIGRAVNNDTSLITSLPEKAMAMASGLMPKRSAEIQPADAEIQADLSIAQMSVGDDARALVAEAGAENVGAEVALAAIYLTGNLGRPDAKEAVRWVDSAAEAGNPYALYLRIRMREDGIMPADAAASLADATRLVDLAQGNSALKPRAAVVMGRLLEKNPDSEIATATLSAEPAPAETKQAEQPALDASQAAPAFQPATVDFSQASAEPVADAPAAAQEAYPIGSPWSAAASAADTTLDDAAPLASSPYSAAAAQANSAEPAAEFSSPYSAAAGNADVANEAPASEPAQLSSPYSAAAAISTEVDAAKKAAAKTVLKVETPKASKAEAKKAEGKKSGASKDAEQKSDEPKPASGEAQKDSASEVEKQRLADLARKDREAYEARINAQGGAPVQTAEVTAGAEPKSKTAGAEPKSKTAGAKAEAPKVEAPKADVPKAAAPKADTAKAVEPKAEAPKVVQAPVLPATAPEAPVQATPAPVAPVVPVVQTAEAVSAQPKSAEKTLIAPTAPAQSASMSSFQAMVAQAQAERDKAPVAQVPAQAPAVPDAAAAPAPSSMTNSAGQKLGEIPQDQQAAVAAFTQMASMGAAPSPNQAPQIAADPTMASPGAPAPGGSSLLTARAQDPEALRKYFKQKLDNNPYLGALQYEVRSVMTESGLTYVLAIYGFGDTKQISQVCQTFGVKRCELR